MRQLYERSRAATEPGIRWRLDFRAASRGPASALTHDTGRTPISERANGLLRIVREQPLLVPLLAWCSAIAVVDGWVIDAVLLGLLVTGPLLAAWRASSATTAFVGVYAVVLAVLLGLQNDMFLSA